VATIVQYSIPHTGRLRQRISDELLRGAHSRRAAGLTDVLEASINYLGISVYPGIYRMTHKKMIQLMTRHRKYLY